MAQNLFRPATEEEERSIANLQLEIAHETGKSFLAEAKRLIAQGDLIAGLDVLNEGLKITEHHAGLSVRTEMRSLKVNIEDQINAVVEALIESADE